MGKFNGLSDAEEEMLTLTMEECGELIQVCSKIMRHGARAAHREGGTNSDHLLEESGDVMACLGVLVKNGFLVASEVNEAALSKLNLLRLNGNGKVHYITEDMLP